MAVLPLQFWPAEVLRTPARPVAPEEFDRALVRFVEDMAETMYLERGIGLAAPQVGVSKRVLVMDVPREGPDGEPDGESHLTFIINPELVAREGTQVYEEGCLSFPGLLAEVTRSKRVTLRYQDVTGARQERVLEGLEAVCIQHEIDHLDGITFVEYLSPLKRKLLLRDLKKTLAERGEQLAL